jgi:preprotein translocase subunit SecA
MRYLERSILLQVIDNRWREHLFDMDYLREGIHLRGFAQIDPLVAYKNEGYQMFQELMHGIWDEFSKLVFRAEIEVQPGAGPVAGGNGEDPARFAYSGGTAEGQPSALAEVAAAGGATGAAAVDVAAAGSAGPGNEVVETVVKGEHENLGRNDPCWCGSGKKYKKCHGA